MSLDKKQLRAVYMAVFTAVLVGGMILVNNRFDIPVLRQYPYIFAVAFVILARLLAQFMVRHKAD